MKEEYSKLKGRAMIRSVVYGSEQGRYLKIRGFLYIVVNGANGHMNLPRKAENQEEEDAFIFWSKLYDLPKSSRKTQGQKLKTQDLSK